MFLDLSVIWRGLPINYYKFENTTEDKKEVLQEKIIFTKKYLIGRTDRYLKRTKKGWITISKQLTDDILREHLLGTKIIGFFPEYQNKKNDKARNKWRIRFINVDVDVHDEMDTPENRIELENLVDHVLLQPEEYFHCDRNCIVKEKTPHGFHLWIIIKENTLQEVVFTYIEMIKPNLKLVFRKFLINDDLEIFPKALMTDNKIQTYGVRGIFHKESDLTTIPICNELDITPMINRSKTVFNEFKKDKKMSKKPTHKHSGNALYNRNSNIDTIKQNHLPCELDQDHTKTGRFISIESKLSPEDQLDRLCNSSKTYLCVKDMIVGEYQLNGTIGNYMRVLLGSYLKHHISREACILAFKNQKDFNYDKTAKNIDYFYQRGYSHPRCSTFKKVSGGGYCNPNCYRLGSVSGGQLKKPKLDQKILGWIGSNGLLEKVKNLIKGKQNIFLQKTTRSGCTTSVIIEGLELKKKILVIAPTIQIFDDTIHEAIIKGIEMGRIPQTYDFSRIRRLGSNKDMCIKAYKKYGWLFERLDNPFPFILKENCKICKYNNKKEWVNIKHRDLNGKETHEGKLKDVQQCEYQKLIQDIKKIDLVYMTTQKFKVLVNMREHSPEAKKLLKLLMNWCDFIFIDECYHLLDCNFHGYEIYKNMDGNIENHLKNAKISLKKLKTFVKNEKNLAFLEDFKNFFSAISQALEILKNDPKAFAVPIGMGHDNMKKNLLNNSKLFKKWYTLFLNYYKKTNDSELGPIINSFLAISSQKVYLEQLLPEENEQIINFCYIDDIKTFLMYLNEVKTHIIMTDAIPPPIDLTKIIPSITIEPINDPNFTALKQKITIYKTRNPLYKGIVSKQDKAEIQYFLEKYVKDPGEPCFIVSQSIKLRRYLGKIIEYDPDLKRLCQVQSYHRGSETTGVKSDLRKMVVFGTSYAPKHAFDIVAMEYRELGLWKGEAWEGELGLYLREYDARHAFFQTISRVKDPKAIEKSYVIVYGMIAGKIKRFFNDLPISTPDIIPFKLFEANIKKEKEI